MIGVNRADRKLLDVLAGEAVSTPPVWMMRQAGRYLPEYRETRRQAGSFLELCYNPALATEVTLQPIRRFGFDAAILFSDILVVPHALGQVVWFVEGEGPRLAPVVDREDFAKLREPNDTAIFTHLAPVFDAVSKIRASLPRDTTFLGFCGAPWTVASYMIAGRGSVDLQAARDLALRDPTLLEELIDRLVAVGIEYLIRQFDAGVDAVQIFESHAGVLPAGEDSFKTWSLQPIQKIVAGVRSRIPHAKIIVFCRGSEVTGHARVIEETGADAVGVDWSVNLADLRGTCRTEIVTQGNLHPEILMQGGYELDRAVDEILSDVNGKAHIFNLGHGILPKTPIQHVEQMLSRIRP